MRPAHAVMLAVLLAGCQSPDSTTATLLTPAPLAPAPQVKDLVTLDLTLHTSGKWDLHVDGPALLPIQVASTRLDRDFPYYGTTLPPTPAMYASASLGAEGAHFGDATPLDGLLAISVAREHAVYFDPEVTAWFVQTACTTSTEWGCPLERLADQGAQHEPRFTANGTIAPNEWPLRTWANLTIASRAPANG